MLSSFTKDTRHRIRDDTDTSAIALKFLCTQLPHWSLVYPYIADDLESVQFRAPGVLDNYAKYKQIEPKELAEMTKNEKNSLLIDHYIETVGFPIDFTKDQKLHAFFLLGQKQKNLVEHLNYLLPDDEKYFEERKRLFQAIQEFELPSTPDVIEQIAEILTSIPKNEVMTEVEEEEATKKEKTQKVGDEYLIDRKIQLPDSGERKTLNDQDLWDNPIISQFKEAAGLARHFPSSKIVSQILSKLINNAEIGSQMMGKFQTEIPSLDGIQRNSDAFRDLLKIIPGEKLQAAIETEEMEQFYHGLKEDKKPKDKLECVQMYVSLLGYLSENVIKKLI
jgi:hypothetical protein